MRFLADLSRTSAALCGLALAACSATNAPLSDGTAAGSPGQLNNVAGSGSSVTPTGGTAAAGSSAVLLGGSGGAPARAGGAPGGGGTSASTGHGGANASAGQPSMAGASNGRGHFEPEDGKTILAIGQDSASIDEYTSSV